MNDETTAVNEADDQPPLPETNGHAVDDLDFSDITTIEMPFNLKGKSYTLREASGSAACQYRNAVMNGMTLGPDGKPVKMEGLADSEPLLVSLCVFDDRQNPIALNKVRSWPNRVVKRLYEKAKKISQLDESPETVDELIKQRDELTKRIEQLQQRETALGN